MDKVLLRFFSIPTVLKRKSVPHCNGHYALTNDPHGCFHITFPLILHKIYLP